MKTAETATAILFDLDDTLYPRIGPFRNAYEKCFAQGGRLSYRSTERGITLLWPVSEEEMQALYRAFLKYGYDVYEDMMQGRISMEEMFDYRIRAAIATRGVSLSPRETAVFQELYAWEQEHLRLSPVMEDLLGYLQEQGCFLGIISNGESAHQKIKYDAMGLERYFPGDRFLPTGDIGVSKPDPRAFRFAEQRWPLPEGRTWYIGDHIEHDVLCAAAVGWHSIWLHCHPEQERPSDTPEGVPDYTVDSEEELYSLIRRIF